MLVPVTEAHIFQPFVSDLQAPLLLWVPRLFIHWFPISLPKHLDYPSSTPGHGRPLAFSQAMHLALCTLHQCNIFTSVPIWAECQLQLGTLLETPLLTSLLELGRHSSVPPHFTPQERGQLPQWFLSYPPASASVLLPMLYRSGKAGASGPSRHQQKSLSVSVAARGNCFASPRLLIIGTLKQQELGFTEDESTVT